MYNKDYWLDLVVLSDEQCLLSCVAINAFILSLLLWMQTYILVMRQIRQDDTADSNDHHSCIY